ncbi:MAG TPA: hypothetical protein VE085_15890 [Burkholderiales bacterium]|nr:hypothetical protein [Burkholderiales bacterium]
MVVELESELDGVLLEPAPAAPLGELELDGLDDEDEEDEPPLALSFLFRSIEVDEELEPEGAVLGAAVVPLADEDEPEGDVVAPDGEVEDELEERSAPRSHAVISVAPSARETATAIVDILMGPPWLGYWCKGARIGPRLLNDHPTSVSAASALHRRLGVAGFRAGVIAALLKVAVLIGLLRIDLALRRVRPVALLAGRRRSGIRGCRGRSCRRLRNDRRAVGFRRRWRSGVAVASP